jgi:Family of unknown function (DUF5996)
MRSSSANFPEIPARGTPQFDGRPNEVPNPVPFRDDRRTRPYDADAVRRFFEAIVAINRVLNRFHTGYVGKVSPVHLFWGSFDLAVTRFSGRSALLHPGGIPGLPDDVTREAYSHEVSSDGFWPGGGGTDFAAFYSYAYPAPKGFADAQPAPKTERISTTSSASSCCPTRWCGNQPSRKRHSWHFLTARIGLQRISGAGIVRLLNVL